MKKLLLAIFSIAIATISNAQTSVSVQIHHKLNGNEFAFNETGTNNFGENFNTDRLEYYLSQISIVHDGGTYTTLLDYAIIDAGSEAILDLGEINANTIESLSFFVGVEEDDNHSDPSSWTSPHPLAPRFPSMHWGWAAGFRFLAVEGTDVGSNQEVQIHALGDENYFEVVIPINQDVTDNEMLINLDANYEKIFENINVTGGIIIHGQEGLAVRALENMRDLVFEVSGGTVSVPKLGNDFTLKAFPNPAVDGNVTIDFNSDKSYNYDITIIDILGKTVATKSNIVNKANINLKLPAAGLYLLNLTYNGETILTKKIIAQ